jgi:hypothetical protein
VIRLNGIQYKKIEGIIDALHRHIPNSMDSTKLKSSLREIISNNTRKRIDTWNLRTEKWDLR